MNDYSDLIFLIAAIAIYGLLVNNTNRSLVLNNQILTDSEIEYGAISVAQSVIEEVRFMEYSKFTNAKKSDTINFLEDLNPKPSLYSLNIAITDTNISSSNKQNKVVHARVQSPFLKNGSNQPRTIQLQFVKTDY